MLLQRPYPNKLFTRQRNAHDALSNNVLGQTFYSLNITSLQTTARMIAESLIPFLPNIDTSYRFS